MVKQQKLRVVLGSRDREILSIGQGVLIGSANQLCHVTMAMYVVRAAAYVQERTNLKIHFDLFTLGNF